MVKSGRGTYCDIEICVRESVEKLESRQVVRVVICYGDGSKIERFEISAADEHTHTWKG